MRSMIKVAVATLAAGLVPLAMAQGKAVLIPAADAKWNDVPGFPGVKTAALRGDPGKGPSHAFHKLPAGFVSPVHHHTPDHYVAVVSGTLVLVVDGKETKLPPGSYFQFNGKKPHLTKCEAGADCVLFADIRGKWDVVADEGKKPAKKK